MRLGARLTLDGLVRALRVRAHEMADEIEAGYADRADRAAGRRKGAERRAGTGADDDDVSGD